MSRASWHRRFRTISSTGDPRNARFDIPWSRGLHRSRRTRRSDGRYTSARFERLWSRREMIICGYTRANISSLGFRVPLRRSSSRCSRLALPPCSRSRLRNKNVFPESRSTASSSLRIGTGRAFEYICILTESQFLVDRMS